MKGNSSQGDRIEIRPLTAADFSRYGWMLGKSIQLDGSIPAFRDRDIDFWQEHVFDPGSGGETEVLWVNYRNTRNEVATLEVHRLCQQAVVPLTGTITQVVATSAPDGSPDMSSIQAFRVPVGAGICMRAGCWHTTRVDLQEVRCLMLTRRSTTLDLAAHLSGGAPLSESAIARIRGKLLVI